jgi:hypothetical protein
MFIKYNFNKNIRMDDNIKKEIRNIRGFLVDLIIDFTNIIFFWLPNNNLRGKALILIHIFLTLFGSVIFFFSKPRSEMRLLFIFVCIMVLLSNLIFKSCIITVAEQRLTGKKETILDQFLIFINIPANHDTRFAMTLGSIFSILLLISWAVFADYFIHN